MTGTRPIPSGPAVVSPYASGDVAIRARRPVSPEGAAASTPIDAVTMTPGSHEVEAAEGSAVVGRWSALVACLATACSLIGPGPVAAAPVQAAAVSTVATGSSPASCATVTPGDASASRDALVERLLSPRPGQAPLPGEIHRQFAATLRQIPTDVLRVLDANGTRVAVIAEGESPLQAGIVAPIELDAAYANPEALAQKAHQAIRAVDAAYAKKTQDLEARVRVAEKKEKASGRMSMDAESLRLDLLSLRSERDSMARRAVQEATDGLVDPATMETAGFLPGVGGTELATTLREMARAHRATGAGEAEEFIALVQRLNGSRLSEAQADYPAKAGAPASGTAVEDLPFLANKADILVPAYEYHRPMDAADGPAMILRTHDAVSDVAWRDGGVLGQYFYQDHRQTVAVSMQAFNGRENASHALLHEMGHAFEDAARRQGTPAYAQFRQERDQAFARIEGNPRHPFAFRHEGSSPAEMTAETFAVTTEKGGAALRKADPAWVRAFERLEAATTTARDAAARPADPDCAR